MLDLILCSVPLNLAMWFWRMGGHRKVKGPSQISFGAFSCYFWAILFPSSLPHQDNKTSKSPSLSFQGTDLAASKGGCYTWHEAGRREQVAFLAFSQQVNLVEGHVATCQYCGRILDKQIMRGFACHTWWGRHSATVTKELEDADDPWSVVNGTLGGRA